MTSSRRAPYAGAALLALGLVAGGMGGAVGASLITGAQIKDGTITSADVANGSLTGTDVKDGSIGTADLSSTARSQLTPTRIVSRLKSATAQAISSTNAAPVMIQGSVRQGTTEVLLGPLGKLSYSAAESYCPNNEMLLLTIAVDGTTWATVSVQMTIDGATHAASYADLDAVRMEPSTATTHQVTVTVTAPVCTAGPTGSPLPVTVSGLELDVLRAS